MKVETFETPQDAAKALAGEVAELIRTRAAEGKNVVLGLATGATPLPFTQSWSACIRRKAFPLPT